MLLESDLVSTAWLEEHLDMETLRVFDTTVYLKHKADGSGYIPESGYDDWNREHIPGSGFLDVIDELSDSSNSVPFMMPKPKDFGQAVRRHGISNGSMVVLYGKGTPMWATRVWWMLRSIGFENVAILDGGWDKWEKESRVTSSDHKPYPVGSLSVTPKPELWVGKEEMLKVEGDSNTVVINALSPEVYSGKKNQYGRPGHLRGSYNVYYGSILDSDDLTFLPIDSLKKRFEESGALEAQKVYTYCGGGISATMDCLALLACGQSNVSVYDGSMSEWVQDESLELVLGDAP